MADPAPSAPLPDDAPERRVSPADQMAALTGEPVEISQPEDDEPAEDRDVSQRPPNRRSRGDGAFPGDCASGHCALEQIPTKRAPVPDAFRLGADAPVSPPAPRERCAPAPNLTAIPPLRSRPSSSRTAAAPPPRKPRTIRTRPREAPRARRRSTGRRWSPQP